MLVLESVDLLAFFICFFVQKKHFLDTDLFKGSRCLHRFPDFQHGIQRLRHIQKHLRKAERHMLYFVLLHRRVFPDIGKRFLADRIDIARIIKPEPSRAPGDLPDFLCFQRSCFFSVKLLCLHKNDPPHR